MSGKDSSRKSQTPSSPPSTSLSAVPVPDPASTVTPVPAQSPAKRPSSGNPIVVGLLGIFLVGLAGVGGGYLHTHPKLTSSPETSPERSQVARISPAPANALPAQAAPVDPPSEVKSSAEPPSDHPGRPGADAPHPRCQDAPAQGPCERDCRGNPGPADSACADCNPCLPTTGAATAKPYPAATIREA